MNVKHVNTSSNKCDGCGNNLIFNPEIKALQCPSCLSVKNIESGSQYAKHAFNFNEPEIDKNEQWANKSKAMKCSNCGASVVLNGFEVSATCPYCDTALVSSGSSNAKIKPDAVIPFAFGSEKATQIFKNKIKNNWFVPKALKQKISPESIHTYYFPAFVYDARCHTKYEGTLYTEHTVRDSNGHTSTHRRYFPIRGMLDTTHNNIEVEASTKIEQTELSLVKPYNFSEAKNFSNDYIAGYSAECYSSSVKETFSYAKALIKNQIKHNVLKRYSYDGVSSLNLQTTYVSQNYSYFLLPMYRINFSYKGKKYTNVINGQTGVVGGTVPKSGWKIALTVIGPILIILLPIILALIFN